MASSRRQTSKLAVQKLVEIFKRIIFLKLASSQRHFETSDSPCKVYVERKTDKTYIEVGKGWAWGSEGYVARQRARQRARTATPTIEVWKCRLICTRRLIFSNFSAPDDTHRGYLDCCNFSDICARPCTLARATFLAAVVII